jgi:hypothetical protein
MEIKKKVQNINKNFLTATTHQPSQQTLFKQQKINNIHPIKKIINIMIPQIIKPLMDQKLITLNS